MKTTLFLFSCSLLLISLSVRVSAQNNIKTMNMVEPIPLSDAEEMVYRFQRDVNSEGKLSVYAWTKAKSLRDMAQRFLDSGDHYVKFYFAADIDSKNQNEGKGILTLILVAAKGDTTRENCYDRTGDGDCFLDDDTLMEPYDVLHPCPPPTCRGRSRFYTMEAENLRSSTPDIRKPKAPPLRPDVERRAKRACIRHNDIGEVKRVTTPKGQIRKSIKK